MPPPGSLETEGSTYRAHLDGLRAVAVYLVVAFHARLGLLSGGFIGVDVFFVLSGYLVTQLLLRDLDGRGSIDLRRFYARRFRRLLPAAAVVLVLTTLAFGVIATPAELLDSSGALRAASLYFANWFYIDQARDYFAAGVSSSPVLHFWSLSVEEQYYAAWPLLLGGLHRLTRRAGAHQRRAVSGLVFLAATASLVAAVVIGRHDLTRAYYGTDTRAYQLLAGGLLALTPGVVSRLRRRGARVERGMGAVTLVGLLVVSLAATSVLDVSAITRGIITTAATVVVILGLEVRSGRIGALLSSRPLVYLGRISYGTYLWHWMVVLVMAATVDISPLATAGVTALVATGLASLSFQLLELPVRQSLRLDRRHLHVIAGGLVTSLLIGVVVAPRLVEPERSGAPVATDPASIAGLTPITDAIDWRAADVDHAEDTPCRAQRIELCTSVEGGSPSILLIGDSHAAMYKPMISALARERGLTFYSAVQGGCFWMWGLRRNELAYDEGCRRLQAQWYETIVPALDPDIVVLVNRVVDSPTSPTPLKDQDAGPLTPGSPELLDVYRRRVEETVASLEADARTIVIIDPLPVAELKADPLACLSQARYLEECRFVAEETATPTERIYREVAEADPAVWLIDLDRQVCPFLPICDPVVNGLIVRWDHAHLTQRFAASLMPAFEQMLVDEGILAAASP